MQKGGNEDKELLALGKVPAEQVKLVIIYLRGCPCWIRVWISWGSLGFMLGELCRVNAILGK